MFQMKITKNTNNFKTPQLDPLGFGEVLVDSTRCQIKITKKIQTLSNTTTVILLSQNKLDLKKKPLERLSAVVWKQLLVL